MGKKLGHLFQYIRVGLLTGAGCASGAGARYALLLLRMSWLTGATILRRDRSP